MKRASHFRQESQSSDGVYPSAKMPSFPRCRKFQVNGVVLCFNLVRSKPKSKVPMSFSCETGCTSSLSL